MLSLIDKLIDPTDCTIFEANDYESLDMTIVATVDTNCNCPPNKVESDVLTVCL